MSLDKFEYWPGRRSGMVKNMESMVPSGYAPADGRVLSTFVTVEECQRALEDAQRRKKVYDEQEERRRRVEAMAFAVDTDPADPTSVAREIYEYLNG